MASWFDDSAAQNRQQSSRYPSTRRSPSGEPSFTLDPAQSAWYSAPNQGQQGSSWMQGIKDLAANAQQSGGGDGGGGGGGSYGYQNVDWSLINAYQQRTPQEQAALSAVTDLAKILQGEGTTMYQIGMPAYSQAMGYVRSILGGDKAAASRAIGPLAGMTADIYGGAAKQIEAGPLRGGARDAALAQVAQGQARDVANLLPQMQQGVLGTAVGGGLGGAQLGGALQGQAGAFQQFVVQSEQQNRQFAIGAEQANRFGIGQLDVANRQIDVNEMLGLKGLELQAQALQQQATQFTQTFGLQQQTFDFYKWYQQQQLALQQQQLQYQQQAAQGQKWGSILGTGLGIAGLIW